MKKLLQGCSDPLIQNGLIIWPLRPVYGLRLSQTQSGHKDLLLFRKFKREKKIFKIILYAVQIKQLPFEMLSLWKIMWKRGLLPAKEVECNNISKWHQWDWLNRAGIRPRIDREKGTEEHQCCFIHAGPHFLWIQSGLIFLPLCSFH